MSDFSTAIAVVLAAALIIANVVVSLAVARSHFYSSGQKSVQIVFVWLVPAAGAIAVGVFLYSQRDNPQFDTRTFPEHSAVAMPEAIHRSSRDQTAPD